MKNLLKQNSYYYTTCLLLFLFATAIIILFPKVEVSLYINTYYNNFLDKLILAVNTIGTWQFAIAVFIFLWIFKGKKVALYALICFVSVSLVTMFLKYIIFPGTPRPSLLIQDIPLRFVDGVIQLKTESFPSGHTSSSFAIATFLALALPHKKLHFIFALIAACVGFARIYLLQHFTTDVYVGMILGVTITTLVYWLLIRKDKKTQPSYRI